MTNDLQVVLYCRCGGRVKDPPNICYCPDCGKLLCKPVEAIGSRMITRLRYIHDKIRGRL